MNLAKSQDEMTFFMPVFLIILEQIGHGSAEINLPSSNPARSDHNPSF